ncbi:MAG: DUF11 domain-containing protein, partial [Anaerolineae bacterium]|nr:DUF11 domain-containing protein [Anaerolineae bacterium]
GCIGTATPIYTRTPRPTTTPIPPTPIPPTATRTPTRTLTRTLTPSRTPTPTVTEARNCQLGNDPQVACTEVPTFTPTFTRTPSPTVTPAQNCQFDVQPQVPCTEVPTFTPTLTHTLTRTPSPTVTAARNCQFGLDPLVACTEVPTFTPSRTPTATITAARNCKLGVDLQVPCTETPTYTPTRWHPPRATPTPTQAACPLSEVCTGQDGVGVSALVTEADQFPQIGASIELRFTVTNENILPVTNITTRITLPPALTFESSSDPANYRDEQWLIANLNANSSITLVVTARVGGSLGATLTSSIALEELNGGKPSSFPVAQVLVIPALCVGEINEGARVNVRIDPRVYQSPGTISNPLNATTLVPVISYNVNFWANQWQSDVDARQNDVNAYYGWYRIIHPQDSFTPKREGWIVDLRLDGCEHLAAPLYFDSTQTVSTDDNTPLPVPVLNPFNPNFRCVTEIDNPQARLDCSAQVYYRFIIHPTVTIDGVVLRELLTAIYPDELQGFPTTNNIPRSLLNAVFINNWRRSCGNGCNGDWLIFWLASKQAWYNKGKSNYLNADVNGLVLNSQNVDILTIFQGTLGQDRVINGQIPIDWGNWWYGILTDSTNLRSGYNQVLYQRSNNAIAPYIATMGCIRIASIEGTKWTDYVFAVVTIQQDQALPPTNTKPKNPTDIPGWVNAPAPQPPSNNCPLNSLPPN